MCKERTRNIEIVAAQGFRMRGSRLSPPAISRKITAKLAVIFRLTMMKLQTTIKALAWIGNQNVPYQNLQQTSPLFYYTESPLSYDMQYDMQLREQQPPRFVLQSKYISALVAMNRITVLYIGREVEIARYQG